jgi:transcriptional regulator with XRE-family HTH domain
MKDEKRDKMEIGEKLKNYRRINFLSQEKLAETSGISLRTIQRIEEGKSSGSAHTLNAIAKALNINSTDLLIQASPNLQNIQQLKILNLSAIAIILIPLANVAFPAYIYWKNTDNEKIKTIGSKILSFQILWTLGTLLLVLIMPIVLLLLFFFLKASSVPLFIPVYFATIIFNVYFIIQFAIKINKQEPFLEKVPNIL